MDDRQPIPVKVVWMTDHPVMLCESGMDDRPPSDVKVVWMKDHPVM